MARPGKVQPALSQPTRWLWTQAMSYWKTGWWQKTIAICFIASAVTCSAMYGVARWYQHTEANKPTTIGVTFITSYASYLGVDAHQTYDAILNDLGVKHLRLVSYWNEGEPTPGAYDFTELDYQMKQAEDHGAKVSLAIGLRQPRWPECHAPTWIDTSNPASEWEGQLTAYMSAVINRYKTSPALESYQLENEYFNHFGQCYNFDRDRLSRELALTHQLDPAHPVILSRSNNYIGTMLRQPLPDIVGVSIYRRNWLPATGHYSQYPYPSWYYGFLAGSQKLLTGKDVVIHELQAEPWAPGGKGILDIDIAEQNKTFDAARFQTTVDFAKQTGIKQMDLWGAEYWYYRQEVLKDPSVWNTARNIFNQ